MNINNDMVAPRLVSKKTVKKLEKIFQRPAVNEPTWRENLFLFYNNNIKPNLFAIIIFSIVIAVLTIKYLLKQEKDEKKEQNLRKKKRLRKLILRQKIQELNLLNQLNKLNQLNETEQNITHTIDKNVLQKIKKKSKKIYNANEDDIYYRASDAESDFDFDSINEDDELENRSDDETSYFSLSKDYEKVLEENDGRLPESLLKDVYEQKKSKTIFDELARLVSGN